MLSTYPTPGTRQEVGSKTDQCPILERFQFKTDARTTLALSVRSVWIP